MIHTDFVFAKKNTLINERERFGRVATHTTMGAEVWQ